MKNIVVGRLGVSLGILLHFKPFLGSGHNNFKKYSGLKPFPNGCRQIENVLMNRIKSATKMCPKNNDLGRKTKDNLGWKRT